LVFTFDNCFHPDGRDDDVVTRDRVTYLFVMGEFASFLKCCSRVVANATARMEDEWRDIHPGLDLGHAAVYGRIVGDAVVAPYVLVLNGGGGDGLAEEFVKDTHGGLCPFWTL